MAPEMIKSPDVLAEQLLFELSRRGLTFAAAESCTGGLITERLTDIPGSSAVVEGGVVSYSNNVKQRLLGVREETLRAFGAVSEETAREMAEGARVATCADVAVSVTGIAGPGGGSAEKPVGTVCFGVTSRYGTKTETVHFDSTLERGIIRRLASDHAIKLALSWAKEGADIQCSKT